MSDNLAIRVENVWKRYGLPLKPWLRIQADRLRGRQGDGIASYGPWALEAVSFAVRPGEALGIVGKNGAGKSTLLKLLAGVSRATQGQIETHGRLFPMIELGAGMHRDLTGRENIRLLGAIMGFSARRMGAKMRAIEDFAELGDWLDKPVWQYSYGMQARLGFSVAVNVDADILLIDEVLSVGDVDFQKKCLARMDELSNGGVTVIFVTHNPYSIQRLCDRAIYLRGGRIAAEGAPSEILTAYFQQSVDKSTAFSGDSLPAHDLREGTGSFRVMDVRMLDARTGEVIDGIKTGDSVTFAIDLKVARPMTDYRFSLRILDPTGTIMSLIDIPPAALGELALTENSTLACTVQGINLLPGEYWLDLAGREADGALIDSISFALYFQVSGADEIAEREENRGLIYLRSNWRLLSRH